MKIKNRKGYYLLDTKDTKAAIQINAEKIKDEVELVINGSKKGVFSIQTSGEYEVKGVFVIALKKNGESMYIMNADDVNILFIHPKIKLTEADLEMIGEVDIMILYGNDEVSSDLVKFINKIDPQILVVGEDLNTKSEEIKKMVGTEVEEEGKILNVKSSNFDNEDYKLQIVHIES